MEFFDILNLVIGVLCVYWAIIGKGYPYKNNYPKKVKKYANKLMRILLAVAGPINLGMFAITYFAKKNNQFIEPWNIVYWVLLGLVVAVIALYIILLYSKYGKIIMQNQKTDQKPRYYK